jgi:uncharacterized protein (TIGR00255 family)
MIRSMTGFGQAERSAAGWRCTAEMRSVNGRHLELRLRLPNGLNHLEERLKKRVKEPCDRGKIEGTITLSPEGEGESMIALNKPLLRSYRSLLRELHEALGQPVIVSLGDLLTNRDLVQFRSWEERREEVETLVEDTLAEALERLVAMRTTEGVALQAVLEEHIGAFRGHVEALKPLTAELPAEYARRLRENLARLSEGNLPGEERILQEITLFADRSDVSEEFARLATHLDHLEKMLGDGGAVGRKIEFLLQELNRETNTLGVKSSDARVSALIIEMKSQLEKLREQIQNIE